MLVEIGKIIGDAGIISGGDLAARDPGVFMETIGADAIVFPRSTEHVSRIMALCHELGQPIVVHGGMSGWVRATQTKQGEIALSLERMNAIEEIDAINRTTTVQAGVVLQSLQESLEPHGLDFMLDLGGRGSCQLGGNASTNAGGLRVIRYGMMREQVLGLEAVLPDGRVISSMNKMIKNNTGYDLKQLFIGSEGTLGVITRLVLRLRERPNSFNTAMVALSDFMSVAALLRHMDRGLGGQLSAFELLDNAFYRVNTCEGRNRAPLASDSPFYAIVEARGADQERDADLFEGVLSDGAERGLFDDAVIAVSGRDRDGIWAIREDLEHVVAEFQPFYAFDVSLPVGDMATYMEEVRSRLHASYPDGKIAFLGHVGDGNLHIAIGAGGPDDREIVERAVYEPLRAEQGSISAEHGVGLEKKAWLSVSRSKEERTLMLELKCMLDPRNILNPGKIFDVPLQSVDG